MSVRKRTRTTPKGERKEAWVVNYRDKAKGGARVQRTFHLKKEADAFVVDMKGEVRDGIHIARSKSVTVALAGGEWIKTAEANGLERGTVENYQDVVTFHIVPFIGSVKLSDLTVPMVRAFEDKLREEGRSPSMVKRARSFLSMLLSDAMERGLATRNVARGLSSNRKRGKERQAERRARGRLKVGVDIPTLDEARAVMANVKGRFRPLILTAMFCGLRSSELRGLIWTNVDLEKREIHVRQRADKYNAIGNPKSEDGHRTVPMLPLVANALREWKLQCPKGDLDLVFPNRKGGIESHNSIVMRGLWPAQVAAGVVVDGKAKYTGLHALRHFYASWCINRKSDGGLELPSKDVQHRLGHSSIGMTMDVYGHLFPKADSRAEMEAAERAFLQTTG
jgi:integrase